MQTFGYLTSVCLELKEWRRKKKNDIIINLEAPRSRFQDIIQGKRYYMDWKVDHCFLKNRL